MSFYLHAWCYEGTMEQNRCLDYHARTKFFNLDNVFWIKLSDLMDIVPRYPHLAFWGKTTARMGHNDDHPYGPFGKDSSGKLMTFNEATHRQEQVYRDFMSSQQHPFGIGSSGQDLTLEEWQHGIEKMYPRIINDLVL